jgi:fatty acid desaturase
MQDTENTIELLFERTTSYIKTSLELFRLKLIDKVSDTISTLIPFIVLMVLMASFILFASFGMAYVLGEMLGGVASGFFVVAVFYVFIGFLLHFAMHAVIKRRIRNYLNKQLLN